MKLWTVQLFDERIITVFAHVADSTPLCSITNYATCPIVNMTHMIYGWLGIVSSPEVASVVRAPEWLT